MRILMRAEAILDARVGGRKQSKRLKCTTEHKLRPGHGGQQRGATREPGLNLTECIGQFRVFASAADFAVSAISAAVDFAASLLASEGLVLGQFYFVRNTPLFRRAGAVSSEVHLGSVLGWLGLGANN